MSRSDVPRADSRPGVRAPKPEERGAPAASAFTTTLAYGVASARKDQPPPPPAQRQPRPKLPQARAPEPFTERDSSSLLDLEAKAPEELHLRFEPVTGITPAHPEPRARRTTPAHMPAPPPALPRAVVSQPPRPELRVEARPPAPRLNLRELGDVEDNSPTTKFATQPPAGIKARYWIYGLAVGLGAAGLVAAGYWAAFVQLTLQDERVTVSQTSASAATDSHANVPAAPLPAAPSQADSTTPPPSAAAEPSQPADEPVSATHGKSAARMHTSRTHNASTAPSEPSAAPAVPEDEEAEEPVAAAPHPEPSPAPAPRLIITPLPDLPAPEGTSAAAPSSVPAPEAPSTAAASSAPEPSAPPAEPAPAPNENLPAQLNREQIQQNLLGMRDKLATCAGTQHGTSYANVTINGSGRVSYSTIDGAFAGTPAGSCMARTLRGATFPRFSGPQMTVRYPYVF